MLKKIMALLWAVGGLGLALAQTIDLNKASEMELDALKGVGPVLTREIMSQRQKAPFKDWEDLNSRVKGMGPQKADSLSGQGVRVQGSAYKGKSVGTAAQKQAAKPADTAKDATGKTRDSAKESGKAAAKSAETTTGKAASSNN